MARTQDIDLDPVLLAAAADKSLVIIIRMMLVPFLGPVIPAQFRSAAAADKFAAFLDPPQYFIDVHKRNRMKIIFI